MVQQTLQVSDNSPTATSPTRVSFSYYLRCRSEAFHPCTPLPSSDFDFCVRKSSGQDSPSAGELFSDGKILPAEIKKIAHKPISPFPPPAIPESGETEMSKEQSCEVSLDESEEKEKQSGNGNGKSFWPFKSSSSLKLNCVSGHGPRFCLLPRSNSTGSGGGYKRTQKTAPSLGKAPVKRSYGNGVRVNPVLHVPVANIFGIGSIFSSFNGRDNKNKTINK